MAARARTVAVLGVLAVLGTPAVADAAPDKAPVGPPQTGWPAAWAYSIEHPAATGSTSSGTPRADSCRCFTSTTSVESRRSAR